MRVDIVILCGHLWEKSQIPSKSSNVAPAEAENELSTDSEGRLGNWTMTFGFGFGHGHPTTKPALPGGESLSAKIKSRLPSDGLRHSCVFPQ
ncbi:putative inorganic phosphate cotransporter-like protein [Corchorus olitorius]|uniref:Inorganic phosphate cotransporter-like protein n=1 Tax=Corchorus olitorius TaxID=93759 RepID=A0A1R3JS66_9ROSI|nr:putative inorganic phosphate cotransporter-like protein [Corchorus olitorius]